MKPTEPQFPDINKYDIPEGVDWSWTAESQNEQGEHEERERTKIPYLSRNAEDILNSKRSRGERL
jgi:hypothetical protein